MDECNCHICGIGTDMYCCDCEKAVCEDHCVPCTYENQLQETVCLECGDIRESDRADELFREWEESEKLRVKKAQAAAKRKETYWKPENVAKRKALKEQRRNEKIEREKKLMEESVKTVNEMFRGMF